MGNRDTKPSMYVCVCVYIYIYIKWVQVTPEEILKKSYIFRDHRFQKDLMVKKPHQLTKLI